MDIILRNSDNVALFSGTDLSVDATGVHGTGWVYPALNSTTATLVQNVTLPSPWVPGAYSYVNGAWNVIDQAAVTAASTASLAAVKTARSAALSTSCAVQITGGFTSSALGAPHTYPSKQTDQLNLLASVAASVLPGVASAWATPFWCCSPAGVWALVQHTAAQIQQVGQDGKTAVTAAIRKNEMLQAQITAATTIAAVEAIVW